MKWLVFSLCVVFFHSTIFATECSLDKSFLEVFICQGHSLLGMNIPEKTS
jgi:hypothetical protein